MPTAVVTPTPTVPTKAPGTAPVVAAAKPHALAKKPKLVRDSFTIPKIKCVVLEKLKRRAALLAHPVKKSEPLRAGIKALAAMSATALHAALKGVPVIKTGRPASGE